MSWSDAKIRVAAILEQIAAFADKAAHRTPNPKTKNGNESEILR